MIKGRLSIYAVAMHAVLVAVAVGAFFSYPVIFSDGDITTDGPVFYMLIFIFVIYTFFAVVSPFVSIRNVHIDDKSLNYRYLLRKRVYLLETIEGYFTMELPSRDYTYETIYPVSRGIILPPVSSFYLSNYEEIKNRIPLKNLGKVRFSWRNYCLILLVKKYNELRK